MKTDYLKFLEEIGVTPEQMETAMLQSEFFCGGMRFGPSKIHGTGMFCLTSIDKNEILGAGMIDGKWTVAGRFTNHSDTPNMDVIKTKDKGFMFLSNSDIPVGEELTVNYRSVKAVLKKEEHHV